MYAWCLYRLGRYAECRKLLENAVLTNYLPGEDPEAHLIELWMRCCEGEYSGVVEASSERIDEYSRSLHPLLSEYLFLRGYGRDRLGNMDGAMEDFKAAHALFKLLGKTNVQAIVSNIIGMLLWQKSQFPQSLTWLEESLGINTELRLSDRISVNHLNIGIAYYKMGRYARSYEELALAAELSESNNLRTNLCRANLALGNVCRLCCDLDEARRHLMTAYTLATQVHVPREECLALEFLGDVHRDEGKPEEALRYYARGKAIAEKIAPQGDLIMELRRREGECLELLDRTAEALPILAEARTHAQKLGDRLEEGVTLRCLAVASAAIADWDAVRKYIDESLAILAEIDARHELAIAHLAAARLKSTQANAPESKAVPIVLLDDAWSHVLSAQHMFLQLDINYWVKETKKVLERIARQRASREKNRPSAALDPPAESRGRSSTGNVTGTRVIAVSPAMRDVLQLCDAFAQHQEPVLITGETGAGKEVVARRIHALSARCGSPFVPVNCAAVPASLFEREFFGHRRGAYTGAEKDTDGFIARAAGGTLLLDEIGELPGEMQVKLLRFLQEGKYIRLGDPVERSADVRLLAATNACLDDLLSAGRFRRDLYYRLKVLEIEVPPLRDRRKDILPLLDHFLSTALGRSQRAQDLLDKRSIQELTRYPWLGNVRELETLALRMIVMLELGGRVDMKHGSGGESRCLTGPAISWAGRGIPEGVSPDDDPRARLLSCLDATGGNRTQAADLLGISRRTLYRWMDRYDVTWPDAGED